MSTWLSYLASKLLELPRAMKRLCALTVDLSLCVLAVWVAYYLRLGEFIALSNGALWAVAASVCIALPIFILSGLYRAIFRYNGWPAFIVMTQVIGTYGLLYASIFMAIGVNGVPRTIGIIQPILLLIFVGGSRALVRIWLGNQYTDMLQDSFRPKALIYGAGTTGRELAAALANSREIKIVGFMDDDVRLHGNLLNGLPIYKPNDLNNLVARHNIRDVLLALPKLSRRRRNEILREIHRARIAVRTLPSMSDLAHGKVSISDVQELDIDDLLGREPVTPSQELLSKDTSSKIVLVTGAGGSIGSELCRQVLALRPTKLLLVDQSEFALYTIHQELEAHSVAHGTTLLPLIASVQDRASMRKIISTWRPDTVYHAAAYKHVPLVEHNTRAGIENNVYGTLNVAQVSVENGVNSFVMVSTDKAVRPTNIMGASKRLAEMILQALTPLYPGTILSVVRFGNVLDSSGSVVPKFRQQIRSGGPITLTHPEVTRFFMTIPEAAQLVIQAGAMAEGGEVFVLDMGAPVKIIDLAQRMIELSGMTVKDETNPDGEIEIKTTGLRPGEKLYEELLIGDNPQPTCHPRIIKAQESFTPWEEIKNHLRSLEEALRFNDIKIIRAKMRCLVPDYRPNSDIVDSTYTEHLNSRIGFQKP
jgi:FlaA1/EpsC-like NDP-sugar epimerase